MFVCTSYQQVCALLFKAVSSEQDPDNHAATLPVLARYSDEEDED